MRRAALWTVLTCWVLVLAGCNLEPKYPLGATAYDAGLVGRWAFQGEPERDGKPGPITVVEFKPRTIPVIDGRLRPDKPLSVEPGQPAPPPNAYTLVIPDEATGRTQEVGAFLLKLGEVRLLSMQWTGGVGGGGLFLYPLHHFMRYERSDDRLTLGLPRCDVVWIPAAQPLDPPEKPRPVPTLAELDGRAEAGMFVTFDIDRTLEVYRQLGVEPAFWRTESLKGIRQGTDAPAANP